ncbi:conserved Plasmodium protein, unknown function [Plasmodium berghei]|uniref:Phosphorylated CTD interacting factor 1 WW domain-containing protein, putative n=2 Tax=Plasmodium berghei TaxID=5821 RepID=A0A509AI20_PLABA|nr:phosphorylated CTD interacting factor 1 WW domain-containing protein, putative [Plasmodium berghei ANKA]CXI24315.1 conserved Plasmodium protein, unknown function [Plasmodium berghei]SCM20276.1 conserved Plasmodium protein, unknown function [Plasmodium berghei]SCN23895.1 conserved Plasmodium protein, unknown function [Plasmodium berghei]SCO59291.1 conserved Plasmodium protein, unknown function [Plasmodium berghei]SCO60308.1 conserved Plasmodium protein, unknown function [Plasmodium berghei]|eukprot:XP_034420830.1 phosphorylated CTD interacting factor 1 WW domain-containing protein, putative [Plasmodium berghei ANKA]
MENLYGLINIHKEYDLQKKIIKLRKVFINIYNFKTFYGEMLKLKNSYPRHKNKKVDKLWIEYKKEYFIKQYKDGIIFYELNKNLCFLEKEIINRYLFNFNISNSNYIVQNEDAYLYFLFYRFCSICKKNWGRKTVIKKEKKKGDKKKKIYKGKDFLNNFWIDKFLKIIIKIDPNYYKKNIYFQSIKDELKKYISSEKCLMKIQYENQRMEKPHNYYFVCMPNCCKKRQIAKDRNISNYKNGRQYYYKVNYHTHNNMSINRVISKQVNSNILIYSNHKKKTLIIDIKKTKRLIQKYIYNDLYFNVIHSIYHTLINKNADLITDYVYKAILLDIENLKNEEEKHDYSKSSYLLIIDKLKKYERVQKKNRHDLYNENIMDNFLVVFKALFIPFFTCEKCVNNKIKSNDIFLFNYIKCILRENIENMFYLTIVNINKIYEHMAFKYLFYLFFLYFIMLDICPYFYISHIIFNDKLRGDEKQIYKYFLMKHKKKKEENIFLEKKHCRNSPNNDYNAIVDKPIYIVCFFCSYYLLKNDKNIDLEMKKKMLIFLVMNIIQVHYTQTDNEIRMMNEMNLLNMKKRQFSFLCSYFDIFINHLFFSEKCNLSFAKLGNVKRCYEYPKAHSCYFIKNKNKIKNNFKQNLKKMNKKCLYLDYFNEAINMKDEKITNNCTEEAKIDGTICTCSPENNLYEHVNEKIKIFLDNFKTFLLHFLDKLYRTSIMHINLYTYLFMIRSSLLLSRKNYENTKDIQKMREEKICKYSQKITNIGKREKYRERTKFLNTFYRKFYLHTYYKLLNTICNDDAKKKILQKFKIKISKLFFYLKKNIFAFNRQSLQILFKLQNIINVYKHNYIREKYISFSKKNIINNMDNIGKESYYIIYTRIRLFATLYFFFFKKGINISFENRQNKIDRECWHNLIANINIKNNKNDCILEKYINIMYKNVKILFPNIYIHINNKDFYIQAKKYFIFFNLKNKDKDNKSWKENIYYEFNGKKYVVFENMYNLKKVYKIKYINLCILFHRYCFFFYNYNPLIFSYLFKHIYCMCIECVQKHLIIGNSCIKKDKTPDKNYHDCFYKQNGILIKNRNNIFVQNFYYLTLFLLIRYHTLLGNARHSGLQGCIPKRIMTLLYKKLKVEKECFSSPFNAILQKYCSFFPDIDIFFGSTGNFFNFNFQNGVYEVNPPFDIFLINKLIVYILYNLKKEEYELTFFLIIPLIKDKNYFYELLFSSPYLSSFFLLKNGLYTFSTRLFETREEEYISTCDCFVFILQNAKAKIKTEIDQNTMLKIKKSWENIHHIKQKNKLN